MTYGSPFLVSALGTSSEVFRRLTPINFAQRDVAPAYNEAWLQQRISDFPELLPIGQIEPAITHPVSVCMELGLPHGFVDNLLLTPAGDIILVETKLWRNFESRRKVVAQILDYAVDMSALGYDDLEARVRVARKDGSTLFNLANPDAPPEQEKRFVDAVARNLRLGRMLLLIVGDGIQEQASELTSFLQGHVQLHFTLALVEMGMSLVPDESLVLIQPRVLSRSVQMERAVIRIERDGSVATPNAIATSPSEARPRTISEEAFYEELANSDPALPERLKTFVRSLEPLGVFPVYTKSLSLKAEAPSGRHYQLGAIERTGKLNTESVNYTALALGRMDLGQRYQDAVAAILPEGQIRRTKQQAMWRVVVGVTEDKPDVAALLDRRDQWMQAISDYVREVASALEG